MAFFTRSRAKGRVEGVGGGEAGVGRVQMCMVGHGTENGGKQRVGSERAGGLPSGDADGHGGPRRSLREGTRRDYISLATGRDGGGQRRRDAQEASSHGVPHIHHSEEERRSPSHPHLVKLNDHIADQPFRMEGPEAVFDLWGGREWGMTLDLRDAFRHLAIAPEDQAWFGLAHKGRFYRQTVW